MAVYLEIQNMEEAFYHFKVFIHVQSFSRRFLLKVDNLHSEV